MLTFHYVCVCIYSVSYSYKGYTCVSKAPSLHSEGSFPNYRDHPTLSFIYYLLFSFLKCTLGRTSRSNLLLFQYFFHLIYFFDLLQRIGKNTASPFWLTNSTISIRSSAVNFNSQIFNFWTASLICYITKYTHIHFGHRDHTYSNILFGLLFYLLIISWAWYFSCRV